MNWLYRLNEISVRIHQINDGLPKLQKYSVLAQQKIVALIHNFDDIAIRAYDSPEVKEKTFDRINILHRIINLYTDTKREVGILKLEYEELVRIHTEYSNPVNESYFSEMAEIISNDENNSHRHDSQISEKELLDFIKDIDLESITNKDNKDDTDDSVILLE